ncbi:MAG: magnesium/cobalt transporter CorA [Bacillota bacterium]
MRYVALRGGEVLSGDRWEALTALRTGSARPLWVDLNGVNDDELAALGREFGFHPLALDDCRDRQHRAKVREFDGHFFVIMNAVARRNHGRPSLAVVELDIFVGPDYMVTVHRSAVPALDGLWGQAHRTDLLKQGADFLFYYLSDVLVDEHFPVLDWIDGQLDQLEARAFNNPDRQVLTELFQLKRQLIALRRSLGPERDIFNVIVRRDFPFLRPQVHLYFLDVYDHLARLIDTIDTYRDMLSNAMDGYLSAVSNRMNEVMKVLTIIATIMMPLTVITGVYGMNFERMPLLRSPWGFSAVMGGMAAVVGAMLLYFRRRKWF